MFGTEMHLITLLYIVVELFVLIFLFGACLSRPKDISRTRFFRLTLFFIIFNLCSGLFPDSNYVIPYFAQNILAYGSGIALASYYFYYLVKELHIESDRFFNPKFLLINLTASLLIGFIATYAVTGDLILSKLTFIVFPVFIGIYFCARTVFYLFKNQDKTGSNLSHHKLMRASGYLGIVFMASIPVVVFFGDYQSINSGLVNISFVLSALAFYKSQLYQSRREYNTLSEIGYFAVQAVKQDSEPQSDCFLDANLTTKEIEVAQLIVENLTYREISERLNIAERTASKHASNIFRKTDCTSKREFINRFS